MSLTKEDLNEIRTIVEVSAEDTKSVLREEIRAVAESVVSVESKVVSVESKLREEIKSSAESVESKLREEIQKSKDEILAKLKEESNDLAAANVKVFAKFDEIDDRFKVVENKIGLVKTR